MKLYTLEEARALLPQVIPVLEQLRDAVIALRADRAAFAAAARGVTGDGSLLANAWEVGEDSGRIDELGAAMQGAIAQLEAWGIELKDPERGLIDFYHQRDGQVVFLCFLLDEPTLLYWHTLEGGFAGRQAL